MGSSTDPRGVLNTETWVDPSSDSREVLGLESTEDTCPKVTEDLCPKERDESGSGKDSSTDRCWETELRRDESEAGMGTWSLCPGTFKSLEQDFELGSFLWPG